MEQKKKQRKKGIKVKIEKWGQGISKFITKVNAKIKLKKQ